MKNNQNHRPEVAKATPSDLEFILDGLKQEYDEDGGSGFWSNREIIREAATEKGDLWVIRHDDQAVAFQVGDYAADIMSVRKEHRQTGLGTALVEASLERAARAGVNVLSVECAPESSLPFWLRMGFEQFDKSGRPDEVFARRTLSRSYAIPSDLPRADVAISFYPEAALHDSEIQPIAVHRVVGARLDSGVILLERRVLGLTDVQPEGRDLVVKIDVDGEERCFCKAKHDPAKNAGVKHDRRGDAFYVDVVEPKRCGIS